MRWVFLGIGLLAAAFTSWMGVRGTISQRTPLMVLPDMDFQPRYNALAPSPFAGFRDGRAMRTPAAGTIAFGGGDYESDAGSPRQNPDFLQADSRYYRGKQGDAWVPQIPVKVDLALLRRGRERYDIYCAICHGATGSGKGLLTEYGLVGVASITDAIHSLLPDGDYFNVITNGKGRMMPLAPQIKVSDRWAIVAYIRALMRSQNTTWDDVPPALRGELKP
ncbi:MAG: c-type cytochrome [Isosphaerales bacterium]